MAENVRVEKITSLDLEELQPYRTLRRPQQHIEAGIFVAEGEKVVRRLLESDLAVVSLLLTPEWYDTLSSTNTPLPQSARVFVAPQALIESIVGFNLHQGVMAVAQVPKPLSIEELVPRLPHPHLLVALDGLVNSENVGVVMRNCAAFGVDAVIVGETSSSPYLRRAVRNSMGTVFRLPVVHVPNLVAALRTLKNNLGTKVVATDLRGNKSIHSEVLAENVCIVLGNEGTGVSAPVLDVATNRMVIPMLSETDSLNVANASAVLLYEARRQRANQA